MLYVAIANNILSDVLYYILLTLYCIFMLSIVVIGFFGFYLLLRGFDVVYSADGPSLFGGLMAWNLLPDNLGDPSLCSSSFSRGLKTTFCNRDLHDIVLYKFN